MKVHSRSTYQSAAGHLTGRKRQDRTSCRRTCCSTIPEIQTVARKTGRAELDEHALGVNVSEIEAPFELKDRSRSELVADVREKLGTIVGANVEIGQPISHRIDAMLSGTKANIAIKLFGDDLNRMFSLGNEIKNSHSGHPRHCRPECGAAD